MASELFVVCYPTVDVAEQVLQECRRLEAAHLLRLEDFVIVSRADDGRLSIHRAVHQKLKDTMLGLLLGACSASGSVHHSWEPALALQGAQSPSACRIQRSMRVSCAN